MPNIRVSIRGLMASIALTAIALAAANNPAGIWPGVMHIFVLGLLCTSAIRGVVLRGSRKLPWLGFALFGMVHFVHSGPTAMPVAHENPMLTSGMTETVIDWMQGNRSTLHEYSSIPGVFGRKPTEPLTAKFGRYYFGVRRRQSQYEEDLYVNHSLKNFVIIGSEVYPEVGKIKYSIALFRLFGNSVVTLLFAMVGALVGSYFASRDLKG